MAARPANLGEEDRPRQGGMVAGAAADEVQVAGALHLLDQRLDLAVAVQHVRKFAGDLRLLVDLLQHEVRVPALLHRVHRLGDGLGLALDESCRP